MSRTRKSQRGFWATCLSMVGTTALLLLLVLAGALVAVPWAVNGAALTVLSGSMEPAISAGDIVVVRGVSVPPDDVAVGDVITFLPYPDDPTLITHRVVAMTADPQGEVKYVTQGDANSAVDEPIGPHQIRGRMMYVVPVLGYVTNAFQNRVPWLVTAAGVFLLVLAAIYLLPRRRRHKVAQAAEAAAEATAQMRAEVAAAPPADVETSALTRVETEPETMATARPAARTEATRVARPVTAAAVVGARSRSPRPGSSGRHTRLTTPVRQARGPHRIPLDPTAAATRDPFAPDQIPQGGLVVTPADVMAGAPTETTGPTGQTSSHRTPTAPLVQSFPAAPLTPVAWTAPVPAAAVTLQAWETAPDSSVAADWIPVPPVLTPRTPVATPDRVATMVPSTLPARAAGQAVAQATRTDFPPVQATAARHRVTTASEPPRRAVNSTQPRTLAELIRSRVAHPGHAWTDQLADDSHELKESLPS